MRAKSWAAPAALVRFRLRGLHIHGSQSPWRTTCVRPSTIGQASRIPGVTPAALSLINIYIEIQAKRSAAASALAESR